MLFEGNLDLGNIFLSLVFVLLEKFYFNIPRNLQHIFIHLSKTKREFLPVLNDFEWKYTILISHFLSVSKYLLQSIIETDLIFYLQIFKKILQKYPKNQKIPFIIYKIISIYLNLNSSKEKPLIKCDILDCLKFLKNQMLFVLIDNHQENLEIENIFSVKNKNNILPYLKCIKSNLVKYDDKDVMKSLIQIILSIGGEVSNLKLNLV